MAKALELTVEEKLNALHDLQKIDTKIDEIRILRGELPMEVKDLEDEIEGLTTRVSKLNAEVEKLEGNVSKNQNAIKAAHDLLAKYDEQSKQVRNDREYEAIGKSVELQKLEIQLCEKKIRDANVKITDRRSYLDESVAKLEKKKEDLVTKKQELTKITADTEIEEQKLLKKSASQAKKIEKRLFDAYSRIRKNYKNGLAVVTIERDSCGGCFAKIPPQRQLEIRQKKRILTCDHCGRIMVDDLPAIE